MNLSMEKIISSQESINTELITPATETKFFCSKADTEKIQTLDCTLFQGDFSSISRMAQILRESTDVNHGVSKLLFLMELRRHW